MTDFSELSDAFRIQAKFCRSSHSPFAALVLEVLADRLTSTSPFALHLAPWTDAKRGKLFADAVPLRLIGAFHYLVLSGQEPALAALYPPICTEPDPTALGDALERATVVNSDLIAGYMASPPQTNEVARSLALAPGFLTVAQQTGLPLRCLELGASAGLNMNWDRFHYRFAEGSTWGDPSSGVDLFSDWTGPSPSIPPEVRVAERLACDQNPIDVRDEAAARRLQSYVWPDQTLRLERLRAAIALKRQTGGIPESGDAGVWAEANVHPSKGVATVVYHSSFIYYPTRDTQTRIREAILAAGAAATPDAPLAWLSKEPSPDNMAGPDEIRLRLWPGGEERLLGRAHPHCAWVEWLS